MLNLMGAIFSGLVIGVLARFFYPGNVTMGLVLTVILGIAGSVVASLVAATFAGANYREGINRAGCLASVIGAMALIFIGRQLGWGG